MSVLQERVAELAERHGSLRAAARVLMVDHTYLYRLSKGEKDDPGDDLLRKLKLRRVVTYERTDTAPPLVKDCPTCAYRDSPGAKGPCRSCTRLWQPENGGATDNWTPIPGVSLVDGQTFSRQTLMEKGNAND